MIDFCPLQKNRSIGPPSVVRDRSPPRNNRDDAPHPSCHADQPVQDRGGEAAPSGGANDANDAHLLLVQEEGRARDAVLHASSAGMPAVPMPHHIEQGRRQQQRTAEHRARPCRTRARQRPLVVRHTLQHKAHGQVQHHDGEVQQVHHPAHGAQNVHAAGEVRVQIATQPGPEYNTRPCAL